MSAGYYLIVQDSVVELTITDGSINGTIQGDFLETSHDEAIRSSFNATTYAERIDRSISTLTLLIDAVAYLSFGADGPNIWTGILLRAIGSLDSGLNAQSLELVCCQTASSSTAMDFISFLSGVNISYEQYPSHNLLGNESVSLKAELVNRTTVDTTYEFSLRDNMLIAA